MLIKGLYKMDFRERGILKDILNITVADTEVAVCEVADSKVNFCYRLTVVRYRAAKNNIILPDPYSPGLSCPPGIDAQSFLPR
ncbi:hypothetical protein GCM10011571_34220 [Marinithermofilum abyssi]|uniref:Uncharacterized protein n=1 Tax=Marinithermofilum abyssi TaxID=1571185 RepID=A0A8J2VMT2_9BACL|nr:hypothetical protein GCM10011571_34220 [Marinithermofilum abyssi]